MISNKRNITREYHAESEAKTEKGKHCTFLHMRQIKTTVI